MDQRIENTFSALQNSMRQLLGQTTWDKITIQRLCEQAGVSRTTFYSHFKHKDDLLDSLLVLFEKAMLHDNNGRSLSETASFKFLPLLFNHVNGNRDLFSQSNTSKEGHPVARRFYSLIERLVNSEIDQSADYPSTNAITRTFIVGGVYNALVQWSASSTDGTHLKLLAEIDELIKTLLVK